MLLEMEHVTGTGRGFQLEDISFALPAGYIMGLAGENGAGKTTLFHYIMDEARQYRGVIRLDGEEIHPQDNTIESKRMINIRKGTRKAEKDVHTRTLEQIGFVSEEQSFLMDRTIAENGKMLGIFYSQWDEIIYEEALQEMELSGRKTLSKLSRGEYLKFQMAFAMAHKPKLYLLDEVTAGMDPVYRIDFFKLLQKVILGGDTSVLMTTHLMEEMRRRMDYVGVLQEGRMISFGEGLVV